MLGFAVGVVNWIHVPDEVNDILAIITLRLGKQNETNQSYFINICLKSWTVAPHWEISHENEQWTMCPEFGKVGTVSQII